MTFWVWVFSKVRDILKSRQFSQLKITLYKQKRGLLKILHLLQIYNVAVIFFLSKQRLLFNILYQSFEHLLLVGIAAMLFVMGFFNSSKVLGFVKNTLSFRYLHNKQSDGLRSGDHEIVCSISFVGMDLYSSE